MIRLINYRYFPSIDNIDNFELLPSLIISKIEVKQMTLLVLESHSLCYNMQRRQLPKQTIAILFPCAYFKFYLKLLLLSFLS